VTGSDRNERYAREGAYTRLLAYLRRDEAQLQEDVTAIVAEVASLRHAADSLDGRPFAPPAGPPGPGQ